MKKRFIVALVAMAVTLMGCDSPKRTVDTLRQEIASFKVAPDDQKQLAVEKSFAHLDEQIATLKQKGKRDEAESLEDQESSLRGEFQSAKVDRAVQDAKKALKGLGDAFKSDVKTITDTFKGNTNK